MLGKLLASLNFKNIKENTNTKINMNQRAEMVIDHNREM